jgi:hypothetical protein
MNKERVEWCCGASPFAIVFGEAVARLEVNRDSHGRRNPGLLTERLRRRHGVLTGLILLSGALASTFNRFEHLFNDLACRACAAVEGHRDPEWTLAVDPVTAFRAEQFKAGGQQGALSLDCCPSRQLRHSLRRQL